MPGSSIMKHPAETGDFTDSVRPGGGTLPSRGRTARATAVGGHAEVLAARRDLVLLYDVVGQATRALLGTLLGLNRRYLPHLRFKWLDQLAAGMSRAPVDLVSRLRTAYRAEPAVAVQELRRLLVETLQLVERHLPEVDTAPGWAAVAGDRSS